MATIPLQRTAVAKTISGNSPLTLSLPEAASQTFERGEWVYLSGGYVTECGHNPGAILGLAAEDGSNGDAGANDVKVVIAHDDVVFAANKSDGSQSAAATAVTDRGKVLVIDQDTTNSKCYVSLAEGDDAANGRLICVDLDGKDVLGDTGGRLLFQVLGNYRQLLSTS
jgi:hypothetical protein